MKRVWFGSAMPAKQEYSIHFRLPADLYKRVARFAKANDLTVTQVVRAALRAFLESKGA